MRKAFSELLIRSYLRDASLHFLRESLFFETMYVTHRRYSVQSEHIAEITRLVNEGFIPIISRTLGFINYTLYADEHGHICSASIFTTRAAMEEANQLALDWAKEHLVHLLGSAAEISQGETLAMKLRQGVINDHVL